MYESGRLTLVFASRSHDLQLSHRRERACIASSSSSFLHCNHTNSNTFTRSATQQHCAGCVRSVCCTRCTTAEGVSPTRSRKTLSSRAWKELASHCLPLSLPHCRTEITTRAPAAHLINTTQHVYVVVVVCDAMRGFNPVFTVARNTPSSTSHESHRLLPHSLSHSKHQHIRTQRIFALMLVCAVVCTLNAS